MLQWGEERRMLGPIFQQELLLGGRRNRLHLFRWIYAGWLVVQVFYLYVLFLHDVDANMQTNPLTGVRSQPRVVSAPQMVGGRFCEAFVWQQLLLLVLVTPALTGGAIADEKRRGTLLYLLSAGVDTREILLGKLLGRMVQVLLIVLTGLPLFALLAGFGGIDPLAILLLGVELLLSLFALSAAALLASVLCRQTREAVLALYLVGGVGWLAVVYLGGILSYFNPLYVLAPVWESSGPLDAPLVLGRLLGSVISWGLVGGGCLALAIWQLRPTYQRELESLPSRRHWYSGERAPLTDDPVRWRELQVEGLFPSRALRNIPQWLVITCIALTTTVLALYILGRSMPPQAGLQEVIRAASRLDLARLAVLMPDASQGFLFLSVGVLLLASLVVGIRCSGSITGERERQTWEALLLTPLSAKQLVRSKLWGVMGASYWYLLAYAAPAVVLSALGGLLALGWTVLWLAVTVLAMYFVGAAGIWCSVRSKSSWGALLGTVGLGYLGGLAIFLVSSPVIAVLAGLLLVVVALIDLILGTRMTNRALTGMTTYMNLFLVAACIGLAVIFLLMARLFLNWAQRHIADRERTRHWHEEPVYRRSRRPLARKPLTWEE
jgi:ABC-type transport system involved in multi-copper enzyme maturation permease subunit